MISVTAVAPKTVVARHIYRSLFLKKNGFFLSAYIFFCSFDF